jgi:hypothetical protein
MREIRTLRSMRLQAESKAQPGMSWRGFGAFAHSALATYFAPESS